MKRTISLLLTLAFCLSLSALRAEAASGYALPERLDGCENIFLSYTFNCSNWSSGRRTKAGYKPLVGYYDTEGTLRDTFFDTFLFLPCVTSTPSGGKTYRDNENPANLSDWRMFIDDVFLDGYNIDALNEAVGEMKATLGASYTDYKARVFLSCMYPVKTQTQFGDLNGDGYGDLVCGSNEGKLLVLYGNEGGLNSTEFVEISVFGVEGDWIAPQIYDLNGDGLNDLLLGTFDGYIAKLLNAGHGSFASAGFIELNEMNYKGNYKAKFGNNCVPVIADINGDGMDDLICGSLEYGMSYPIDSEYFPYKTELMDQIKYFVDNGIYVGAHFYLSLIHI